MAHTKNAVIYDSNGYVVMQVIPDHDSELSDPAYNPKGYTQIQVAHVPGVEPWKTAAAANPGLNLKIPNQVTLSAAVSAAVG